MSCWHIGVTAKEPTAPWSKAGWFTRDADAGIQETGLRSFKTGTLLPMDRIRGKGSRWRTSGRRPRAGLSTVVAEPDRDSVDLWVMASCVTTSGDRETLRMTMSRHREQGPSPRSDHGW